MILVSQDEPMHFELEEDFEIELPKSKYGWATHRIPFTKKQWFYLAVFQGAGNFALNFILNLFLTWVMYPKEDGYYITFKGKFIECIFTDIVITSFVLPFLTNLALSVLVTLDLRKGKVQPIDERWLNHPLFRQIPTGIFWKKIIKRGLIIAIICCFCVSFITLIPLYIAVGLNGMVVKWAYCIFKGIFCATYAALISPTIAFILMASFNPRHTFFENHK